MKKVGFVLCILVLAVVGLSVVAADGPAEGRVGRAEVRFMEGMIDHHSMAIDMAQDCLQKAESDDLKQLCQDIIDKQGEEIKTLQQWLDQWYSITYNPMTMADMMGQMPEDMMMGGMMMGGMMHGMEHGERGQGGIPAGMDPPMMMGMMAGLSRLEGQEYEVAWMEAMIDHHDDAINMAERILERGEHQELLDMAQQIIDDQKAEIEKMEQMIAERSGT